jgi:transposase InsO family protein
MFSMKVDRKFQLLGVDLYTGIPEEIISDEGGEFNAKAIHQSLYDIFRIKKLTTTSYHQQANGQCERFNRTMSTYMRIRIQ